MNNCDTNHNLCFGTEVYSYPCGPKVFRQAGSLFYMWFTVAGRYPNVRLKPHISSKRVNQLINRMATKKMSTQNNSLDRETHDSIILRLCWVIVWCTGASIFLACAFWSHMLLKQRFTSCTWSLHWHKFQKNLLFNFPPSSKQKTTPLRMTLVKNWKKTEWADNTIKIINLRDCIT